MKKKKTTLNINNEKYTDEISAHMTLLDYIRRNIGLTGSKEGCGTGDCGTCSMLVNGELVKSCLVLAVECDQADITTIEGLSEDEKLHPVQEAFVKHWGTQCGYCTPGFVMAGKALLDENPNPTDDQIKHETAGNLCRCTGYVKIIDAIKDAAKQM